MKGIACLTRLLQKVMLGSLALAALFALRQSYRVRRSLAEAESPTPLPLPTPAPPVSILVPVRNEEDNVDGVLASLLAQDYPDFEVTVVDDGSTDGTAVLLATWAAREARLHLQRVGTLPEGWAGKVHALHLGVGLTTGEWLLFTDADTRHAPQALRLMVGYAVAHQDDLLSMVPDVKLVGPAMRRLPPIGALMLVEWATPAETRDPKHPHALAVGQYLLVRREAYVASGGYAVPGLRQTFAEDVALAAWLKRQGRRVDIVDGRGLVSNVQWTTWSSAWRGWRKSAYAQGVKHPLAYLILGLWLLLYGLGPPITLLRALCRGSRRRWLSLVLAGTALAAQIDARGVLDRRQGLAGAWSLSAPIGWAAFGGLLLDTVRLVLSGAGADWKGRRAPRV
jgi:chlorobactene glucosyltransferase